MFRRTCGTALALVWGLVLCGHELSGSDEPADAESADDSAQVLYLRTEFFPYRIDIESSPTHHLGRELARQAILIAGRDELGLAICDESLRESVPGGANVVRVLPSERLDKAGKWSIRMMPFSVNATPWEKTFESVSDVALLYADSVPKFEAAARGDFAEALRGMGLRDARSRSGAPTAPDADVEQLLLQVTWPAQCAAAQTAHAAIAAQGETPPWLGVLTRAYANLALLTDHHWNAGSDVFTARSWLYAQRLCVVMEESDWALWHRAYAWAWGGALHHALADLEKVPLHTADAAAERVANEPPWSQLIQPYCRCDGDELEAIAARDKTLAPWAARLRFQWASLQGQPRRMHRESIRMQQLCPTDYGVYVDLVSRGKYSRIRQTGSTAGLQQFGAHVGKDLLMIPGLPESVIELAGSSASTSVTREQPNADAPLSPQVRQLADLLRKETQAVPGAGLSWSALAYLLEEEQFVLVASYLAQARADSERSLEEDVDRFLPWVGSHPYARYIESYRYDSYADPGKVRDTLARIRYEDPRRNMVALFAAMEDSSFGDRYNYAAKSFQVAKHNCTIQGIVEYLAHAMWNTRSAESDRSPELIPVLKTIAPHCDTGVLLEILWQAEADAGQLRKWEDQLRQDPWAFSQLAKRYRKAGDLAGAVRCCQRSLALVPTNEAALELAGIYREQGLEAQWEQTLLDFLRHEDLGLEHAVVQWQLLETYGRRGAWAQAEPLAAAIAQNDTREGLWWASSVAEHLGRWKQSEIWTRTKALYYPRVSGWDWYFWCRRTGRGDLEHARMLAEAYFQQELRAEPTNDNLQGCYRVLESEPQEALKLFQRVFAATPDLPAALMIAQLSREVKHEEQRSDILDAMRKKILQQRPTADAAQLRASNMAISMADLLASGNASADRLTQLDQMLSGLTASEQSAFAYLLGRELDAIGKHTEAEKYWRHSLFCYGIDRRYATLAGMELAKRHGTSRADDDVPREGEGWLLDVPELEF